MCFLSVPKTLPQHPSGKGFRTATIFFSFLNYARCQELLAKQDAYAIRDVTGQVKKGLGTLIRENPPSLVFVLD